MTGKSEDLQVTLKGNLEVALPWFHNEEILNMAAMGDSTKNGYPMLPLIQGL